MSELLRDLIERYKLSVEHNLLFFLDGKFEYLLSKFDSQLKAIIEQYPLSIEYGILLYIPSNTVIINPVNVLFLSTDTRKNNTFITNIFHVGEASTITIVEEFVGCSDVTYSNQVDTALKLEKNAVMDFYKLQNESTLGTHTENFKITQARGSFINASYVGLGGKDACDNIEVSLEGISGRCDLKGLYMPKDKQNLECHMLVEHKAANCISKELFKNVVDDCARATFDGKVVVRSGAFNSSAKLNNKNLLLTDEARVTTKPALEVYIDEVQCTHGATVGQLDQAALWYLRSRGIPEAEARKMLIDGFVQEITMNLPEFLRAKVK